ncbi:MAG: histidine kinase [Hyphomicrobiales bacterium]|nr:MAG: histidine kinase [Hyphomicrobiales bacterium]
MILSAAVLTLIGLVVAGLILTSLYRNSVEKEFDRRLESHIEALVSDFSGQTVEKEDGEALSKPQNPGSLFSIPQSGWYWQVAKTGSDEVLFSSDSLIGSDLQLLQVGNNRGDIDNALPVNILGLDGETVRLLLGHINLPGNRAFDIAVTGNFTVLENDIISFRSSLILTFAVFSLFLVLAIYIQVRMGLRPLGKIRAALREVQAGREEKVEGTYPREIAPVVDEINVLIDANRGVVDRARTHVGNLAHALKTPLSVIANEPSGNKETDKKISEQVTIMRNQINHYLARARSAAGLAAVGTATPANPVIESLVRTMQKIYQDRGLVVEQLPGPDIIFRGEKQDLEEIVGNLVDNASKWAKSRVVVSTDRKSSNQWILTVEDDGAGMTPQECETALKRGERLDESVDGSGLGLNIVVESVALYNGNMKLERSDMGGLKAILTLPSVS